MNLDPKVQYCRCGYQWLPKWYHKIFMLIFGEYNRRCPQCNSVMTFELIHHVVKINTEKGRCSEIWRKS